jgi:hypothetical protein
VVFPDSGAYDFLPEAADLPDDPRIAKTPLEVRLRVAVTEALEAKGYTLGGEMPRFLVGFRVAVEPNEQFAAMFGSPETAAEWATELGLPDAPEKGTLVIRLHHPETLQPIWVGTCCGDAVSTDVPEEQKRRRLSSIAHLIFEDFPPCVAVGSPSENG